MNEINTVKIHEVKKGDIILFRIKTGTKDEIEKAHEIFLKIINDRSKVHDLICTEKHEIEVIKFVD